MSNDNFKNQPNYEPNSLNGPTEDKKYKWAQQTMNGKTGRYPYEHPNDNFEQPRALFRKVMNEQQRTNLINNITGDLKNCRRDIQERMVKFFYKIDAEYGGRIAKGLGIPIEQAKM